MSLVASTISVIAGYVITVIIQIWLYPLFGIAIPATEALVISLIIVLAAFVKNFSIRRLINLYHYYVVRRIRCYWMKVGANGWI